MPPPAMLEDPSAATIYRVSGDAPYPDPENPALPPTIVPHHVVLRDRQTVATVIPFASQHDVPESLLQYLNEQFNKEIDSGDTYPMMNPLPLNKFARYWFQNFAGIMLLGHIDNARDVVEGKDWSKECLGTFYIKPNYPGRSSHICNAGFIVTDASRNRGVGRLMGETYLEWAPKLGYTYSVFNLVYETNVASCKIWDGLGFKRIGRVKGAGDLKSHPDRLVDAIIFGRDLGSPTGAGSEELVSEERFDKIKFYLKYGRYPNGADRAEKSRLRSAAMHYKLLEGDVLMLKDKEVISDPQRQYEIAREVHSQSHTGINKCTATIAERYHWSRIKETVSDVIRVCSECKEMGKASSSHAPPQTATFSQKRPHPNTSSGAPSSKRSSPSPTAPGPVLDMATSGMSRPTLTSLADTTRLGPFSHHQFGEAPETLPLLAPSSHTLQRGPDGTLTSHHASISHNAMLQDPLHHPLHPPPHHSLPLPPSSHPPLSLPPLTDPHLSSAIYQPIDPQIISHQPSDHAPLHHHLPPPQPSHHITYTPYHAHAPPHHHHHHHPPHDPEAATFQALLNASEDDTPHHHHHHQQQPGLHHHHHPPPPHRTQEEDDAEQAAVDRDMEMLIEQPQDDEDEQQHPNTGQQQQPGQTQHGRSTSSTGTNMYADANGAVPAAAAAVSSGGAAAATGSTATTVKSTPQSKMDVSHLLWTHEEGEGEDGEAGASDGGGATLGGRGRGIYDGGFDGPPGG